MQSDLKASYNEVDFSIDCIACIDKTTTGPVSPNGYYLYSGHVGRPLTGY